MKSHLCSYLVLLISVFILFSSVLAAPGLPHQFKGTVTINGNPASDGTEVFAVVDGDTYATFTVGGVFGTDPAEPFFTPDPYSGRAGETIEFFVEDQATGITAIFENDGFTELPPLAITQNSGDPGNPGNPGSPGGPGGPGPSGGGSTIILTIVGNCINEEVLVTAAYTNGNVNRGVQINILKDTSIVASGTTNLDGKFRFTLTEPGEYTLEAKKSGFPRAQAAINLKDCTIPETPNNGADPNAPVTTDTPSNPTTTSTTNTTEDTTGTAPNTTNLITGFLGLGGTVGNALLIILLIIGIGAIYIGWQRSKK
ncbi:carboxypeptidase-like regulatory domain-containing protein [Candidatus Micrarchaeota archaeon]|nr:carboxypeptidase-like regulatory domain-containing protein [Candidatus Micrarchaeota archaeon]MBU1930281.1 carboxypeptidase-like regulatory domain-containing protein [Candidatus Micrarchaeota archaeon]